MKIPSEINNTRARILSVLVVFVMVASAMVIVIPDANEGAEAVIVEQPSATATHVVISEVLYDDDGADNHVFVEL